MTGRCRFILSAKVSCNGRRTVVTSQRRLQFLEYITAYTRVKIFVSKITVYLDNNSQDLPIAHRTCVYCCATCFSMSDISVDFGRKNLAFEDTVLFFAFFRLNHQNTILRLAQFLLYGSSESGWRKKTENMENS